MVVAPGSAMLFQSMSAGRRPSEPWPVTYWRRRARSRWVSETPSRLAAPWAALMPGTTSTGMPAARQAAISSVARPKIIGTPPLRRTTRLPALPSAWTSVEHTAALHPPDHAVGPVAIETKMSLEDAMLHCPNLLDHATA